MILLKDFIEGAKGTADAYPRQNGRLRGAARFGCYSIERVVIVMVPDVLVHSDLR